MTYPVLADINSDGSNASTTSHPCALPAGATAGRRALLIVAVSGAAAGVTPAGWTLLDSNTTGQEYTMFYERLLTGGEATPDVTTVAGTRYVYVCMVFTGALGFAFSTVTTAANSAPNAGACTPSWGSATTLWVNVVSTQSPVNATSSPAGYGTTTEVFPANGPSVAVATKNATAASEDPGAITLSSGVAWLAWCVGVRPAVPRAFAVTM